MDRLDEWPYSSKGRMIGCSSRKGSGSCLRPCADEPSNRPELKPRARAISQAFSRRALRPQAQETLQHPGAFDAAGLTIAWAQRACGPADAQLVQEVRRAPLDPVDLLPGDVLSACVLNRPCSCRTWTAICSLRWLKIRTSGRPTHPDLPRQVLRRHRVVAATSTWPSRCTIRWLRGEREPLGGSGKGRAFRFLEYPADLRRVVPWIRVSATSVPSRQEAVLRLQAVEAAPFQRVVLT